MSTFVLQCALKHRLTETGNLGGRVPVCCLWRHSNRMGKPKSNLKIELRVPAELHAYPKVWNIDVNLVLIGGFVVRVEPAVSIDAPDGDYELHYHFGGRQEDRRVRVERGDILGD